MAEPVGGDDLAAAARHHDEHELVVVHLHAAAAAIAAQPVLEQRAALVLADRPLPQPLERVRGEVQRARRRGPTPPAVGHQRCDAHATGARRTLLARGCLLQSTAWRPRPRKWGRPRRGGPAAPEPGSPAPAAEQRTGRRPAERCDGAMRHRHGRGAAPRAWQAAASAQVGVRAPSGCWAPAPWRVRRRHRVRPDHAAPPGSKHGLAATLAKERPPTAGRDCGVELEADISTE